MTRMALESHTKFFSQEHTTDKRFLRSIVRTCKKLASQTTYGEIGFGADTTGTGATYTNMRSAGGLKTDTFDLFYERRREYDEAYTRMARRVPHIPTVKPVFESISYVGALDTYHECVPGDPHWPEVVFDDFEEEEAVHVAHKVIEDVLKRTMYKVSTGLDLHHANTPLCTDDPFDWHRQKTTFEGLHPHWGQKPSIAGNPSVTARESSSSYESDDSEIDPRAIVHDDDVPTEAFLWTNLRSAFAGY